jgi:MAC/Perforin domain
MADTDKTTIVGQWLSVNGAGKYTKTFFDKGFKELRDLTEEAVSAIVSDDPALARKLAESLEELADPGSDPAPPPWSGPSEPRPAIPSLPPKTKLDLSQPTVNVPDIPEFTVPAMLSVSADTTAVTHPGNLTQGDWLIIARNSRILYAYTMENAPDDGEPPQARRAALDWMVPDSTDFLVPLELGATVLSKVTYTAESASYVRAGFDKQQASVGFPFAAASFEREHKERQAGASYQKQLQMIGRWHYPRVQLNLKECATASERFKTAIRAALGAYDKSTDIKPLLKVFEEFGTAVPSEVILGGQMLLVHTEDYQGTVNESEVENVISAAVSIKTTKAEGSVGVSFQNAQGNKVSGDSVNKATTFTVRGGDATRASDPPSWPGTVKPPSQWAVIGRSKLTPILEWLPEDLRSRVMTLWPKVPVAPAIWELQDTFARDHSGKAERAQFVVGGRIVLGDRDGARGAVQLVCGTSMTPELGRGDAAGGRASFHRYRPNDIWIDTSSVYLPVPAGHNYTAATPDTSGKAPARFAIAETNLTLGKWQLVEQSGAFLQDMEWRGFDAETDGFVFCSLEARNNGERGYATCAVDQTIIAAASVHNYPTSDCWLQHASFCAPYAKGSRVDVLVKPTSGYALTFSVWRIPSTSQAWTFTKPEPITLGAYVTAATDGFVNGVVTVPGDGPRGILRLDCVKDRPAPSTGFPSYPIASAAVHVYHHSDRWISHSSAMIPVRKDYLIFADWRPTSGAPQAQVYWTGVVPVV